MVTATHPLIGSFVDAINARDFAAMEAHFAPDADFHQLPDDVPQSPAGFVDVMRRSFLRAFPEARVALHETLATGDVVAHVWSWRARHTGYLGDVPPTGELVTHSGITLHRLTGGKISERCLFEAGRGESAPSADPTHADELVRVVHELNRTLNEHDLDGLLACYAPDAHIHRLPDDIPQTPEGWIRLVERSFLKEFPDVQVQIDEIVTTGNVAAYRWSWSTRRSDRLPAVGPTAEEVGHSGLTAIRLVDGRVTESCVFPLRDRQAQGEHPAHSQQSR